MERNETITYMKAIAIILMVLGHSNNFYLQYQIIYMFHMPLFFIVSGYCFKEKYLHEPFMFLYRRIKGLWWPYVKWSLIFLAFHNVFYRLHIYNTQYGGTKTAFLYSLSDYQEQAVNIVWHMAGTEPIPVGYWFLNALFFGSIIAFFLIYMCEKISNKMCLSNYLVKTLGGGGLLVACIAINAMHKTFTVFYIGPQALLAASFFYIGHCISICNVPKLTILQMGVAFALVIMNSFYNFCGMHEYFYDTSSIVPYIFTALLGTWCIYSIPFQRLNTICKTLLDYIGRHTLIILTWHYLCFVLVSYFLVIVYGQSVDRVAQRPVILEYANQGWFIIYTIVGVGLPLLVNYGVTKLSLVKRMGLNF